MKTKIFFLFFLAVPLFAVLKSNKNTISNIHNVTEINTNEFDVTSTTTNVIHHENSVADDAVPQGLKGELKKKSYTHSQQMKGSSCAPYTTCRSSKIRSHGKTVGKVKTHKTSIGVKSTLYDENDNKIGSVHRVGNNTVYRDANGKRLSRREAKRRGLR